MNRTHWVLNLCFLGVIWLCFISLGFSWLKGQEKLRRPVVAEVRR